MYFAVLTNPCGSQLAKEVGIIERLPSVARAVILHSNTVAADAVSVKRGKRKGIQHGHVLSFCCGVAEHGLNGFWGTLVVALAIAPVSALQWVVVDVHRLVVSVCPGDCDRDVLAVVLLVDDHILLCQDIHADFRRRVDQLPELTDQLLGMGQVNRPK